jgi:hypothetical protein
VLPLCLSAARQQGYTLRINGTEAKMNYKSVITVSLLLLSLALGLCSCGAAGLAGQLGNIGNISGDDDGTPDQGPGDFGVGGGGGGNSPDDDGTPDQGSGDFGGDDDRNDDRDDRDDRDDDDDDDNRGRG